MVHRQDRKAIYKRTGRRHHGRAHRVVITLLAVVIACFILALLAWTIDMSAERKKRSVTKRHFQDIAMALANYSQVFGHLPRPVHFAEVAHAGNTGSPIAIPQALYSWRVAIVPFIVSWHGHWDPSQRWDGPENSQLIELSGYYCYDQSFSVGMVPSHSRNQFPEANVLAITGPGTAFGDGKQLPAAWHDIDADTIVAVESCASGIPWPAPGDCDIRHLSAEMTWSTGHAFSSPRHGGGHVIFADGSVWFLAATVPRQALAKFFTLEDARRYDRDKLLRPFALEENW